MSADWMEVGREKAGDHYANAKQLPRPASGGAAQATKKNSLVYHANDCLDGGENN